QTKLAALGLGSFDESGTFIPSEYVGPNPQLVEKQIEGEKSRITLLNGSMKSTGTIINEQGSGLSTNLTSAYGSIDSDIGSITATIQAVLDSADDDAAPAGAANEVSTRTD